MVQKYKPLYIRGLHHCTSALARVQFALDLHHFCTIAPSAVFIGESMIAAILCVLHSWRFLSVKVGANCMLFSVRVFALVFALVFQ